MTPTPNFKEQGVPFRRAPFSNKNQEKYSIISYNNKKAEREAKKSKKRLKKLVRQQERKQKGLSPC